MNPPNWTQYLLGFVLLALAGFALVIFSGFWHTLTLIAIAVLIVWFWKPNRNTPGK